MLYQNGSGRLEKKMGNNAIELVTWSHQLNKQNVMRTGKSSLRGIFHQVLIKLTGNQVC